MALPTTGYLQLGTDGATGRSINSEFQYGNDMASYQGVYYGKSGIEYRFPVSGNPIDMDSFHGTNKITGGNASLGTGYWTVPVYNTITLSVQGGNGGGGGQDGVSNCPSIAGNNGSNPGNNGNAGGTAYIGGYVSAGGGYGGGHGFNTSNGGPGASSSATFTNPVQGGNGPPSGTQIYVDSGARGNGGNGGNNAYIFYGYCVGGNTQSAGPNGSAGYANASWS